MTTGTSTDCMYWSVRTTAMLVSTVSARLVIPIGPSMTAGAGSPGAPGYFRHAIRASMRVAGRRRCVVWANIYRPPVGGVSYHHLNAVLAREARRRKNLRIFQWVRMARRHRGWFGPDGVHPTGVGYHARARGIARVVRRCHA